MKPMLSIIIPVLNEEAALPVCLKQLQSVGPLLPPHEIFIVDGGSTDRTREVAQYDGARLLTARRGRGPQMNAGAAAASGEWLFFLHADCALSPAAARRLRQICEEKKLAGGCFSQKIDHPNPLFLWIAWTGNFRAQTQKIFFGDQGIFVRREIFEKLGGYPEIPILEEVVFTEKLRQAGPVEIQREKIECSSRRWDKTGILKTHWINFKVMRGFSRGVPPEKLKDLYLDIR